MSTPSVKITRQGIEVLEVPTDVTNLEMRMDAVEAKNIAQDVSLGVNGGTIAVLQGDIADNATRLGDLVAVEAAVVALQGLNPGSVTQSTVDAAIVALQDASVSNVATITAVSDALSALEAGKVTDSETAITALQGLVGGIQVISLATKAQVDLKKDDESKVTFGSDFRSALTGILDNAVFPADQDWANTYVLTQDTVDNPPYGTTITGYAGLDAAANPDKKSINMALVIENDTDRYEHYAGIRGLGSVAAESEAFSNAHLMQFNNSLPYALTLGKAMSAGNKLDRETRLNDIVPKYSNIAFIQVVREFSPVEVKFYTDSGEVDSPVILTGNQSIRKMQTFAAKEAADADNRYPTTAYDRNQSLSDSYVIVEPAEDVTVEHCMSQSLGLWTNRADTTTAAYKLRTSVEFAKIDELIASNVSGATANVYTVAKADVDRVLAEKYSMYTYIIGGPDQGVHAFKRLEEFVDNWCDKEYILEAPHGTVQYDVFQYTVPALIELLYLTDDEKLDTSNARTAWDITKEEVFDVIGMEMANGAHVNLEMVNYAFPTGQYGSSPLGVAFGTHYYYSYETANGYGMPFLPVANYEPINGKYSNYNAVNYMSVDDIMKLCRVVARGGVMENGVRLLNPDIFEALFQPRMAVSQPITAVALDGTVDNCYGSLWRGISCFGAPVRGPGVLPAEAYLRNDRATDIISLSVPGKIPVIAAGDLTTWVVETPPQRCIVLPVSATTGNYISIYPDSHTVSMILTDDGIETRLAEYKSITSEIYKHLAK